MDTILKHVNESHVSRLCKKERKNCWKTFNGSENSVMLRIRLINQWTGTGEAKDLKLGINNHFLNTLY
jgi:hypothetical protein